MRGVGLGRRRPLVFFEHHRVFWCRNRNQSLDWLIWLSWLGAGMITPTKQFGEAFSRLSLGPGLRFVIGFNGLSRHTRRWGHAHVRVRLFRMHLKLPPSWLLLHWRLIFMEQGRWDLSQRGFEATVIANTRWLVGGRMERIRVTGLPVGG